MDILLLLDELAQGLERCSSGGWFTKQDSCRWFSDPTPISTDLSALLLSQRAYRGGGRAALIDLVVEEFEHSNRADLAEKLTGMIATATNQLAHWEQTWGGTVQEFSNAVEAKRRIHPEFIPEDADYLGRIVGSVNYAAINEIELVRSAFYEIVGWIRRHIKRERLARGIPQGEDVQPKSDPSGAAVVTPDNVTEKPRKKAKPSPWHDFGISPPSDFKWNLTGLKKDLTRWILMDTKKGAHRGLDSKLKNGSLWGQQGKGDNWIVWFKDQRAYSQANTRRLADEVGNTKEHPETV